MAEMRQLEDDEKKLINKRLKTIEGEYDHLIWLKDYNKLMLDRGLYMNYLEKIRQAKKGDIDLKAEIKFNKNIVNELKRQLVEGVEVKTKPSGVG